LDPNKKGKINAEDIGTIMDILGQHQNDAALKDLIATVDKEGNFNERRPHSQQSPRLPFLYLELIL